MCIGKLGLRQPRRDPVTIAGSFLAMSRAQRRGAGGGEVVPLVCLNEVLGNTVADAVHEPKTELSVGVALFRGSAEPPCRLGVVLGNALAFVVHEPEVELSQGVALLGRTTEPPNRLVQPGGAAVYPLFHRLRNTNESIRWMSMHASGSSSGSSLMGFVCTLRTRHQGGRYNGRHDDDQHQGDTGVPKDSDPHKAAN